MMKHILILIIPFSILFLIKGCSEKTITSNNPQEVVITGQVINKRQYDPNTIVLLINDIATGEQIRYLDDLDEAGNFEIRFERYYPHEVLLKYNFIWNVYIHPGDSIHIELDAEKLGSDEDIYHALTFSGDAVKENEQLSFINGWFSKIRKEESVSNASRYSPETYKLYRDSLRNNYHKEAKDLIEAHNITEPIKSWIYYEIERNYYNNLVTYPMIHRKLNNYPENWEVPISYYSFFEKTNFDSEFILNSNFAKSFISYFYSFYIHNNIRQELTHKGLVKDTTFSDGRTTQLWKAENLDSIMIDGINRFAPKGIKQFVLYNYFTTKQKHQTDNGTFEKYLPLINKEITEQFLLANLQKIYSRTKESENTPLHTNRKNIVDASNNEGTKILKEIISNNENKVIYICCWTISCGAGLKEMSNSTKLMAELKDKNVEFVFLCCNSPEGAARKKVEELKLGGTHYSLDTDQTNYVQKELSFSSYPAYILIDKNGNIVRSNMHYRPGNERTKVKILELVNERI